jgi:hypothetical protein
MNDTPRTNFVAHETGDAEWDRFPNRFGRMMAHACILERELAAAIAQRDKAIAFLQVYRNDTPLGHQPHMIAHEVDPFLTECE